MDLRDANVTHGAMPTGAYVISADSIPPEPVEVQTKAQDVVVTYSPSKDNTLRMYFAPTVKNPTERYYNELTFRIEKGLAGKLGATKMVAEAEPVFGFVYVEVGPLAVSPQKYYVEYLLQDFC